MLPNSAASKLAPLLPNFVSRATPSAKEAVVMTPIAASAPILRRRVTDVMARAEASPQTPAPSRTLMPSSGAAAKPPKMACDSPWPM
jgi:hypothetical protein